MVKEKKELKKVDNKKTKVDTKNKTQKVKKEKKLKEKPITTFKSEFSKVKWPSKKEMVKYSIATIVFVIFFGVFFFAIAALMSFLKTII